MSKRGAHTSQQHARCPAWRRASRAHATQGSGVAGVRRASDACGRWRGPSPATAEGRPTAAPESWRARRMLGIDATHVSRHPRRHGLARARRRARGRARAMRANAGFSETPSRSSARIPPPCAHPGGGDDPSTRGGSRVSTGSARRRAASLEASLASSSTPAPGARLSRVFPCRKVARFPDERAFFLPQALEARSHPRPPTSSPSSHAQQVVAPTPAPSTRCPSRAPWAR